MDQSDPRQNSIELRASKDARSFTLRSPLVEKKGVSHIVIPRSSARALKDR